MITAALFTLSSVLGVWEKPKYDKTNSETLKDKLLIPFIICYIRFYHNIRTHLCIVKFKSLKGLNAMCVYVLMARQ